MSQNIFDSELNAIIYYMQKGWTPADFNQIYDSYIWDYYIAAYEILQEKENERFSEYSKMGVMLYGG